MYYNETILHRPLRRAERHQRAGEGYIHLKHTDLDMKPAPLCYAPGGDRGIECNYKART